MINFPLVAQNKIALLVGISDYHCIDKDNLWNDIHGTNDVDLLSGVLKRQNFLVTSLKNEQATFINIVEQLETICQKAKKGDLVFIHFSLHGQPFEDTDGDEIDGWDESLIPIDAKQEFSNNYKGENHLIDDKLSVLVDKISNKIGTEGIVYVVLDACHAGSSFRDFDDEKETFVRGTKLGFSPSGKMYKAISSKTEVFKPSLSNNQSQIVYFEACKNNQVNTEILMNNKYYGALSYYLSKVISINYLKKDNAEIIFSEVKKKMDDDMNLSNQDMVIEKKR